MKPRNSIGNAWKTTRSGAWASRGFHFQHLLSTLILLRQWAGLAPSGFLIPEGEEDCVIEMIDYNLWIQIKSRKEGAFSKTEIKKILHAIEERASDCAKSNRGKISIILERPCKDIKSKEIDLLFAPKTTNIVVCNDPEKKIMELLTRHLKTAEIIAEGILSDLYKLVADAAAANASLDFIQRRRISVTEVEKRIFERLEAEDPSAIDEALISGSVLPVDFVTPLDEPDFYQGVKVKPGHVASGLVFSRPKVAKEVAESLKHNRNLLVTGPSGAGKSSLLWLVANTLERDARWFQVTGNSTAVDGHGIARFIRARQPSEYSPIGLAFDEVNPTNSDLWNFLSSELRGLPSVYLFGSIRQEDVSLVSSHSEVKLFQVSLDEELARIVWEKLNLKKQTVWEHWREPFEQSQGLMLEYVHILTKGGRLQAVIRDQVRDRQINKRDNELAIIRSAAVICSYGAEVQVSKLISILGIRPDDASRALSRLLDEHLLRESRPGVLGGLHSLRSEALSKASHDELIFSRKDSLWQNLSAVTTESLPRLLHGLLQNKDTASEASILAKLAQILKKTPDSELWIAIISGLGLATLDHHVSSLMEILEKQMIPRNLWNFASMLCDHSIDLSSFPDSGHWGNTKDAVASFRSLPKEDLRYKCLEYLPCDIAIPPCVNLKQANELLSSLAPIFGNEQAPTQISFEFLGGDYKEIHEVAALLSSAYLFGSEVAEQILEQFGGEQKLFSLFYYQTPWMTRPIIEPNGPNGRTVRSDYHYCGGVNPSDPHSVIVDVCETLIAISPGSQSAASEVVNPDGKPVPGCESLSWSKDIPRVNLAPKARVSWNTAFRKILLGKSAAESLTFHSNQVAILIKRTEKIFRLYTEKWIRSKAVTGGDTISAEINDILDCVDRLAGSVPGGVSTEMTLVFSKEYKMDRFGLLVTRILGNLTRRMSNSTEKHERINSAVFASTLASEVREGINSEVWRTISKPPKTELVALGDRLSDVSNILHEMANSSDLLSIQKIVKSSKVTSYGKGISKASRYCLSLSEKRFNILFENLKKALKKKGWNTRCYSRRINESDCLIWPPMEVSILVVISCYIEEQSCIEDCFSLGKNILGETWQYSVVPVINNYALPALALLSGPNGPSLDFDYAKRWSDRIGFPLMQPVTLDYFNQTLETAIQISGLLAYIDFENHHSDELDTLTSRLDTLTESFMLFSESISTLESESVDFSDPYGYLIDIVRMVNQEYEAKSRKQAISSPIWSNANSILSKELDGDTIELAVMRILILQAECKRAGWISKNQLNTTQ